MAINLLKNSKVFSLLLLQVFCYFTDGSSIIAQSLQLQAAKLTSEQINRATITSLDKYFPIARLQLPNMGTKNIMYHADYQQLILIKPAHKSLHIIPKWSANNLPFFCKIEHKYLTRFPIPAIFRLGW